MILSTSMPLTDPSEEEIKRKTSKTLLWFGMVSIVMIFAGLTSAYIVRQGEGKWVEFALPSVFRISTIIILLSSVTMQWSLASVRKGNMKAFRTGLLLTLLLGLGFAVSQYVAWTELYSHGIAFSSRLSDIKTDYNYVPSAHETFADSADAGNVSGSFLYVITALHILHLLAGLIAIIVVFSRATMNKYSPQNYNGVNMCAVYWHFLDGLWVYLFFFLLYIR